MTSLLSSWKVQSRRKERFNTKFNDNNSGYNGMKVPTGNKDFSVDSHFWKTEEWDRFLNKGK